MPATKTLFIKLLTALLFPTAFILLAGTSPAFGAELKQLPGHVSDAVKHLQPIGNLPATNELHLAIGVQLRDPAGLDRFLADVYNSASPNYRHFLMPEEFAARFGPTEADYAAVKNFALANGFKITGTHANRLLLDATARAADVERAFHLHLKKYRHPTEAREFFAPDAEPTVDAALPVLDVQGLSDFVRPHPKLHKLNPKTIVSRNGSAPNSSGEYFGDDFRNAYAPGTTLTGAGQMVGLLQFDGFYSNDIAAYAQQAGGGRTNIVVQTVLLDGYDGTPGSGNIEVSLDIEMAMSMAPGLAGIVLFEAGPTGSPNDVLNAMAASNTVKNLSCSWGWGGGPSATTDNIFKTLAAQGQSFFNASGDSDAFTLPADNSVNGVDTITNANAPSSSPYITQVGGTTLTTGTGASYSSETVWNWGLQSNGSYEGSSGGVSSYYSIPDWQTNIDMTTNLGSMTRRNIPDVALTADNVYVIYNGNATGGGVGGTSCAAPLWAGFMALVNQMASMFGNSPAGFINPAIYAIGKGANPQYGYTACFKDITSGNNYWSQSPSQYPATTGYDLCTGWGTPNGTNLINALAGLVDPLIIIPASGFTASGIVSGPFTGAPQTLTLTNAGANSLSWSLVNTSSWLAISISSGTLAAGKQTNVTASLTAAANNLALGTYAALVLFSNQVTQVAQPRQFSLDVLSPLSVFPANGFVASGPVGGDFNLTTKNYALTNLGASSLTWGIVNTSLWLTATPTRGSLPPGAHSACTVALTPSAYTLPTGVYAANVLVTNQGVVSATLPFTLLIGQSLVQNGGFETGDFTGWTLVGDTTISGSVANGVVGSSFAPDGISYVHSGTYGAVLGENGFLATLSQPVFTVPGQSYLLSLWLINPTNLTTQIFQVNWNAANLYSFSNPPVALSFSWTNLTFVVTAAGTNSTLQFAAENDKDYFGLDDVSLTPIPKPSFTTLAKTGGSLAFTWNSLAGVSYLVQYKTNLLQANWISLSTNTATAGTTSFTNAMGADPQRFYRIRQLP